MYFFLIIKNYIKNIKLIILIYIFILFNNLNLNIKIFMYYFQIIIYKKNNLNNLNKNKNNEVLKYIIFNKILIFFI